MGENALWSPLHIILVQNGIRSVSSQRKKHFRLHTNLRSAEKSSALARKWLRFAILALASSHETVAFPFPSSVLEPKRYAYVKRYHYRPFYRRKRYPAYLARGAQEEN